MTSTTLPIARLEPGTVDIANTSIQGVVTLVWPYSSSKKTFSILLAEPDFRRRRDKGQIRITFRKSCAKALARAEIASGDELTIRLSGCKWSSEDAAVIRTPGKSVGWELTFDHQLHLQVTRNGETQSIEVDGASQSPELQAVSTPLAPRTPLLQPTANSPPYSVKSVDSWSSPAFLKKRTFDTALASSSYDIFADDSIITDERAAKRTKIGRGSQQWRFVARSPSPTPSASASEGHAEVALADTAEGIELVRELSEPTPLLVAHDQPGSNAIPDSVLQVEQQKGSPNGDLNNEQTSTEQKTYDPVAIPSVSQDDVSREQPSSKNFTQPIVLAEVPLVVEVPNEFANQGNHFELSVTSTAQSVIHDEEGMSHFKATSVELPSLASLDSSMLQMPTEEWQSFAAQNDNASNYTDQQNLNAENTPLSSLEEVKYPHTDISSTNIIAQDQYDEEHIFDAVNLPESPVDQRADLSLGQFDQPSSATTDDIQSHEPADDVHQTGDEDSDMAKSETSDDRIIFRSLRNEDKAELEENTESEGDSDPRTDTLGVPAYGNDLERGASQEADGAAEFIDEVGCDSDAESDTESDAESLDANDDDELHLTRERAALSEESDDEDIDEEADDSDPASEEMQPAALYKQSSAQTELIELSSDEESSDSESEEGPDSFDGGPLNRSDQVDAETEVQSSPKKLQQVTSPQREYHSDRGASGSESPSKETQNNRLPDSLELGTEIAVPEDGRANNDQVVDDVAAELVVETTAAIERTDAAKTTAEGEMEWEAASTVVTVSFNEEESQYLQQMIQQPLADDASIQRSEEVSLVSEGDLTASIAAIASMEEIATNDKNQSNQDEERPKIQAIETDEDLHEALEKQQNVGEDGKGDVSIYEQEDEIDKEALLDATRHLDDNSNATVKAKDQNLLPVGDNTDSSQALTLSSVHEAVDDANQVHSQETRLVDQSEAVVSPSRDESAIERKDSETGDRKTAIDGDVYVPTTDTTGVSPEQNLRRSTRLTRQQSSSLDQSLDTQEAADVPPQQSSQGRSRRQPKLEGHDSSQNQSVIRDEPSKQRSGEAEQADRLEVEVEDKNASPKTQAQVSTRGLRTTRSRKSRTNHVPANEEPEISSDPILPSDNDPAPGHEDSHILALDGTEEEVRTRGRSVRRFQRSTRRSESPQRDVGDASRTTRSRRSRASPLPVAQTAPQLAKLEAQRSPLTLARENTLTRAVSRPRRHRKEASIDDVSQQLLRDFHRAQEAEQNLPPFTNGVRTKHAYISPLSNLTQQNRKVVDGTLTLVVGTSKPERAATGPRDWHMTLYVTDGSMQGASQPLRSVQIFRPSKSALPVSAVADDVILLHNFRCQSQHRKPMLISTEASCWAVFSEKGEVKSSGPPVEFDEEEIELSQQLHSWWEKTAGEKKMQLRTDFMQARDAAKEAARRKSGRRPVVKPGAVAHELRDGTVYPFTDTPLLSDDLD